MSAEAAGAHQAMVNAIRASGAIVRVEPREFMGILGRVDSPLVVVATGGVFTTNYRYLTGYKGMIFFTKSPVELPLPGEVEVVRAKSIWIPQ